MKVKKTMTFDENVLAKVQAYAKSQGISLSAAFSVLACMAIDAKTLWKENDGESLMQEYRKAQSDLFNCFPSEVHDK